MALPAPSERLNGSPRLFYRSMLDFFRDLPGTAKRFWILVVLTGAAGGLSAAVLVKVLRWVTHLAWSPGGGEHFLPAVEAAGPLQRLLVPTAAGLLVTLVSLAVRKPLKGHGTATIIESIWMKSGRMQLPWTLLRGAVSIVAVGLGAPLGREGALLQTGAATGSALARKLKLPPDQMRLLVACGASAGIAAAYNVPIGAALFGLEVLLGSFALELFGPIVLSCVVATLLSRVLIADHPSYLIPHYQLVSQKELLLVLVFGPLLGLASALYVRMIELGSVLLEKAPKWLGPWLPVCSMALVGAAALRYPQVLGNGYDSVNDALQGTLPLLLLVLLPLLKLLATSLCAGAGVPGGLFTPSLFFGALLGGAFGQLAHLVFPGIAPPGAYALMGMGAVLAGTTHASVSAVLIIFELTGNYSIILPLMLCCVLSAAVSRLLEPESLYTGVLIRRNVKLPEKRNPNWLKTATVSMLLEPNPPTVSPRTSFLEVVAQLLDVSGGTDLYVVNDQGRLLGTLVLDALKGHIPDHSLLDMAIASDFMDSSLRPLNVDVSLSEVALRFADTPQERLPVVDRDGKLLGTISKGDVLRHGRF